MSNTNSCSRPKSCTCDAVYDQLHWVWCHASECEYSPEKEVFNPQEAHEIRQRALASRVRYMVSQDKAYCVASSLLKEFAPETYAELYNQ